MALITVFILHRGCHPVAATIDPDDATLTRLIGGTPATLTAGGLEVVVAAEREHDPAAPRRVVSLGGDIVALPGTAVVMGPERTSLPARRLGDIYAALDRPLSVVTDGERVFTIPIVRA